MDPYHTHSNSHYQYYQCPTGTPYQRAGSEDGDHPTAASLQAQAVGGACYHLVSPSHSGSQYSTYSQSHSAHHHGHSHTRESALIHQVVEPFSQQPPRSQLGHPQQYPSTSLGHSVAHHSQSAPKNSRQGSREEADTQRLKNLLQRTGLTGCHKYETWKVVERGIDWHYARLWYNGQAISTTLTGHRTARKAKEEAAYLAYPMLR